MVFTRLQQVCVTSPYEAIAALNTAAGGRSTVNAGAGLHGRTAEPAMAAAVAAAAAADAVVFVIGGDWGIEHEGMDRTTIALPGDQATLVSRVKSAVGAGVPVVVVMVHGGSMDISEVIESADAVVDAFCACAAAPALLSLPFTACPVC